MAVGRGAVEFVVAGFAGPRIHPDVARGLREQVDRGVIRIIDLLFLQKDTEGLVRQFDLDGVGNELLQRAVSAPVRADHRRERVREDRRRRERHLERVAV